MSTLLDIAMQHADPLIESARKGNDHAFNKLVSLWYKRIYNYALKYCGDHDMAMDIAQKTFIVVHEKLPQLRELSSFRPWLYKITLNHCRDEERRFAKRAVTSLHDSEQQVKMEVEGRMSSDIDHRPDKKLHRKELASKIMDCLQLLNEDQREVVIMKEYEGLKFREIAEALGISENTAKSRLYYGLKTMRKLLTEARVNSEYYNYE